MENPSESLRREIGQLVSRYYQSAFEPRPFVRGQTPIPASGKVFDEREMQTLIEACLDFWLTAGRFAAEFEAELAKFVGCRSASLVNSGSSANLLALSVLTSPELGERRLKTGDEVITVASGFPTTVNPILQNGLTPVFVDVRLGTYDIDAAQLPAALSDRTRAIMIAHTLGNPFDVNAVTQFARDHNLWLIEDCCDALGSRFDGKMCGTFGDLATLSFYPAHHITMGEGGAVLSNRPGMRRLVNSFRDWGRDCWCDPGKENTCGKRFDWQLGQLPHGFDHKYIYSHIGYNLKATDMQAAVGMAQLQKLPGFIEARKNNFAFLFEALRDLAEFLALPKATEQSEPSWFGFPLAVRDGRRDDLVKFLNSRKIGTRLLFGGNLLKQPAYQGISFRQIGSLPNSDFVMRNVFWIGVYPGLTPEMLAFVAESIHEFFKAPASR